jgi:predicted TIM-barrel fold metal-dependent hydrolase
MADVTNGSLPGPRTIVDVHAHHAPPGLGRRSDPSQVLTQPTQEPFEARFARMEEAGVGLQVLSSTTPTYLADPSEAVDRARIVNDELAARCLQDPARFRFWASLPLPHVGEALAEMQRVLGHPGAAGIMLGCSCQGGSIAREAFDPIYAEMQRRRGVIFLHPVQNGLTSPLINDLGLTVCAGASMEDSIAALHLIARQIPQRFPSIRFIVPHFGGILPMLLNRLDGQMPRAPGATAPSEVARKFFYDTVGWGSKAALIAAVEAFGDKQIVSGSDYPILLSWESYSQTFRHISQSGLPAVVIENILFNNAKSLLNLDLVK